MLTSASPDSTAPQGLLPPLQCGGRAKLYKRNIHHRTASERIKQSVKNKFRLHSAVVAKHLYGYLCFSIFLLAPKRPQHQNLREKWQEPSQYRMFFHISSFKNTQFCRQSYFLDLLHGIALQSAHFHSYPWSHKVSFQYIYDTNSFASFFPRCRYALQHQHSITLSLQLL